MKYILQASTYSTTHVAVDFDLKSDRHAIAFAKRWRRNYEDDADISVLNAKTRKRYIVTAVCHYQLPLGEA